MVLPFFVAFSCRCQLQRFFTEYSRGLPVLKSREPRRSSSRTFLKKLQPPAPANKKIAKISKINLEIKSIIPIFVS